MTSGAGTINAAAKVAGARAGGHGDAAQAMDVSAHAHASEARETRRVREVDTARRCGVIVAERVSSKRAIERRGSRPSHATVLYPTVITASSSAASPASPSSIAALRTAWSPCS
jgi:hypothetical protein